MKRRHFVKKATLSSFATIIGTELVFGSKMLNGYTPLALQDPDPFKLFNKHKDMVVLNDKPWNIEAQAHLLDDKITPNSCMFIRNNGLVPEDIDPKTWTLTIDGESVNNKKTYTLSDLKSKFQQHTYQLTLECGGNGRAEFDPPAKGNQWTVGAVHCASWTGVRLRDILDDVGIKNNAVYIGYHAIDKHLSMDPDKEPISRGCPMSKALQDETIIAFKMNGEDIPLVHGYPLRLVAGGWPASVSGKWINRISIRDKVHDGTKMTGTAYRIPCKPVAPGEKVKDQDMCIIESMPVKSLITYPKTGAIINKGKSLNIRGHAWAGELEVSKMEYSIDFGSTWETCTVEKPLNRLAWQHFSASINFPKSGYYEVWALSPHHIGEYIVASDFKAIGEDVWYWIWMYRIHIFGWVTMGIAMFALVSVIARKPYRVLILPGAGMVIIGTFTLAIASAYFYNFGAWGVGQTAGKSAADIQAFVDDILFTNQYVTCFIRFGRVFSGVGLVLLGVGFIKWKIVSVWLGWFTAILGLLAMGIIMGIPDNYEIYKPMFHVKVVWLVVMGIVLLKQGVRLPEETKS